jgi:hypothetical protein
MHKQRTRLIQSQPGKVLGVTPRDRDKMPGSVDMRAKLPVALLRHKEMAHSVTTVQRQQLVLQLQRHLGNSYVTRILEAQRGAISGHRNPGAPRIIKRQTDSSPSPERITADPVPPVIGTGEPHDVVAVARPPTVRLRGRTRARFNGGNFRTENVVTEAGSGCRRCRGKNCVHVTGTVITEYHVTTTVTLPKASSFRRLTQCQRERVQDAIDNILAPHEQDHVDAFETYNGTTEQPFDLNLCRGQLPRAVKKMVRDEERPRRAASQAQSDALDPFNFDVDLDCTD